MMKGLNNVIADVLDVDDAENAVTVERINIVDSCERKLYEVLSNLIPADEISDDAATEHEAVVNELRLVCAGVSKAKASMMDRASQVSQARAEKVRAVQ